MEFLQGIGAGWMNLASLALGFLAWMLPVAAMIRTAARPRALHPALPLVCVSFAACAAALYLQLRYHAHLSRIEDVELFGYGAGGCVRIGRAAVRDAGAERPCAVRGGRLRAESGGPGVSSPK